MQSNNPAVVSMVNGKLRQCNGALPLPLHVRIPDARRICEAFGLDFEDTGNAVPCFVSESMRDICVNRDALAAWITSHER